MYGFLQDDVRRLERRLDELHVLIERGESRGVPPMLENCVYKHAGRARRADPSQADTLPTSEKASNGSTTRQMKDTLQEQSMDLRRRVEDLAAPLDIAGSRLNRYAQRVAAGTPAVEPRTSAGTEER